MCAHIRMHTFPIFHVRIGVWWEEKQAGLATFICFLVGWALCHRYRLVGLVVKASASRAEDPGFESRLDNFTCCHTEIEVADPTFYLTQSQYTDTGPTSPSADPITPGAWQGSHWSANVWVTGMTGPWKNPGTSGIRTQDLPLSRRAPYH